MRIHRPIAFFIFFALAAVACDEFGTDPDTGGDPAPAVIEIVSGDAQVGAIGQALEQPLVVRVLDQFDDPYQGATVTWSTDQGALSSSTTTTNAEGEAEVTWTLGVGTGSQTAAAALSDSVDVTFTATAESGMCESSGTLPVPGSVNGTLQAGDCVAPDTTFYDAWTVEISQDTTYTFALTSNDFDAFFVLLDDAGDVVAFDDDGGEETNSEAVVSLSSGTYIAIANTFASGETGAYTLSVAIGGEVTSCVEGDVAAADTVQGTLESGDCTLGDGSFFEVWLLTIDQTETLTFTMTSSELDAYLIIADSTNSVIDEDDDSAGGTDARLSNLELNAGTYQVVTTTWPDDTGAYTLMVTGGSAAASNGVALAPASRDPFARKADKDASVPSEGSPQWR